MKKLLLTFSGRRPLIMLVALATILSGGFFVAEAKAVAENIVITKPENGNLWRGEQAIEWAATGNEGDQVYIYYSSTGIFPGQYIGQYNYNAGSIIWDTVGLPETATYKIRITDSLAQNAGGDTAGNFLIDNTPPISSFGINPDFADGENGWYINAPTVTLSCSDNLSGCKETFYRWGGEAEYSLYSVPFFAPEGARTLYYYSLDNAVDMSGFNNIETERDIPLYIDLTEPESVITSPSAGTWHSDDFIVNVSDNDSISGLSLCEYQVGVKEGETWKYPSLWTERNCSLPITITVGEDMDCPYEGANICRVRVKAKDLAGISNYDRYNPIAVNYNIDWTAPEVNLAAPLENSVAINSMAVSAAVTDNLGDTECFYVFDEGIRNPIDCGGGIVPVDGLSEGRHILTFYGVDEAGNEASDSVNFIVNNDGILTVCGSEADFPVIQAAIDAAEPGDTVSVCAGTYNESVDLNKSLSLTGSGRETCLINGPVKISANGSAVSGFEIIPGGVLGEIAGVYLQGDLSNIGILNNRINGTGVAGAVRGILVETGREYSSVNIESNIINDVTSGVYLNPHSGIMHITDNEIYNTVAGIGGLNNAHVAGNYFHDNAEAIGADSTITGSAYTVVENKILDPVNAYGGVTINAGYNWWGTAHRPTIAGRNSGDVKIDPYYVNEEMTILSSDPVSETYVDDDYSDGNAGGHYFGYDAFDNITDGVDAVWFGGKVTVAPGLYEENVLINKNVSLIGPKTDLPAAGRTFGSNEAVISGAMMITAANVSVNGFSLTHPGGTNAVIIKNGSGDTNNVRFAYNIFENIGGPSLDGNVHCVYVEYGADSVIIENNRFASISGLKTVSGIFIGDTASIDASEFTTISNNIFTGIQAGKGAYGILINNAAGTPDAQILNNHFSALHGSWTHAIGLEGSTPNVIVTGNDFANLSSGGMDTAAVFFQDNPAGGTAVMHHNKFNENLFFGVSVHISDWGMYAVNAAQNWWGSIEGPTDMFSDPNRNPYGNGAAVLPVVNFISWCTDPECTDYDTQAPTAALNDLPENPTNNNDAAVSVGGEGVVYYKYTLHEGYGPETPVSEPIILTDLPDGVHTLHVIGRDQAGNWQTFPTMHTWIVDTVAPVLAEAVAIPTPGNDNAPAYVFSSSEAGELTFSGGCFSTINEAVAGENEVSFPLADGYYDSCLITVTDSAGNPGLLLVSPFMIDTAMPEVNAGSDAVINKEFLQTGTAEDDRSGIDPDSYIWSKVSGPGNVFFGTANSIATLISADSDGVYVIRFEAYDLAGNTAYDEMQLTWDTASPLMLSSSPINGATGVNYPDGMAAVRFNAGLALVDEGKVMLSDNATDVSKKGEVYADGDTVYIPYTGAEPAATYRINVLPGAVRDTAGNLSVENIILYFTTSDLPGDEVSPTVTGWHPYDGEGSVPVDTAVYLTFDEIIDASTVNSANIQIRKAADGSPVTATVSLVEGGLRANIEPADDLLFDTEYYLYASAEVSDAAGNPLNEFTSLPFRTEIDTADHIAPIVEFSWPSGLSGIPVNAYPYMDFSEPIMISTMNEANIRLYLLGEGTEKVPASIVVKNGGTRAEIQPDSSLVYGAIYKVVVEGVSDEAGNIMAGAYEGEAFTTEEMPSVELAVTGVSIIRSMALAGGGYENGWLWKFEITAPEEEDNFWMRFNDWTNGMGGTIAAAGNMRYWSAQGDYDSADNAVYIGSNDYPLTPISLSGDLSSALGRQIQVYVEMRIPEDAAGGSYSTSYQVSTEIAEAY